MRYNPVETIKGTWHTLRQLPTPYEGLLWAFRPEDLKGFTAGKIAFEGREVSWEGARRDA
jgi:hypothetical protein